MKRRNFLRGMLHGSVVTVALPPLLYFQPKAFAADGFPSRFLFWFWGNGNRPDQWTPAGEGDGDNWTLSESLTPLAGFKEQLAVISGMSLKVPNILPHTSGLVGLVTGQAAAGGEGDWTVAGPSIDQLIANEIGGDTVYRSLVTGCVTNETSATL